MLSRVLDVVPTMLSRTPATLPTTLSLAFEMESFVLDFTSVL